MQRSVALTPHTLEVEAGQRFTFGKNWKRFLRGLNEDRIRHAEASLCRMLQIDRLDRKTFLDVGSGSGLFSLAARRLGARVRSFDYDPMSVACTEELRGRYFPEDPDWRIETASVLDKDYLARLGTFDVVYSWGVLHHTGAMWRALESVASLVAPEGHLYLAIYNDQREVTEYWKWVKRQYNRGPLARLAIIALHAPYLLGAPWLVRTLTRRVKPTRGMSPWTDTVDWLGGYPFEVAKPEEIVEFYQAKGFRLSKMKTCGGRHGCNEFVFVKLPKGVSATAV